MKVRNFRPDDAVQLAEILHASVHEIGSKYYTQAQTNAWSPAPVSADEFLARVSDGRSVFVAVDEADKPLGFIELEQDGHIDCFYCHPKSTRMGVGAELYAKLEAAALKHGQTRLNVEASEAAKAFFLNVGFTPIKRREFERNGVKIHNYLMEKALR